MCVRKFIPIVSDAAVAALCTFMLAFTFVRYHFGNTYGLIAALPAALAAGTLVFLYKGRKRKRALDTAAMSAGAEKLAAHLALLGPEESAALFARGLDGAKPDGSVAETDRGLYFCSFTPEPADRNALLTAKATLAQAKAQLTIANNNLSYCSVKSPSDGVVGKLPYRLGALVSSSMPQPLTTVSDNSEMYIYFSMPEKDAIETARQYGSLEKAVEKMPLISLKLSDGTIYSEKGKVESVTGSINTSTGTVSLRAKFPNNNKFLISGSTGSVIMPVAYNNVIIIPQEATYALQDKTVCYKVVDGKAKSQIISVSKTNNGKEYVVLDGLKAGDEIVATGAGLVREGTQIK